MALLLLSAASAAADRNDDAPSAEPAASPGRDRPANTTAAESPSTSPGTNATASPPSPPSSAPSASKAKEGDRFDGFRTEGRFHNGTHVSFRWEGPQCQILDLRLAGVPLLDLVEVGAPCTLDLDSRRAVVEGNGTRVRIHDAPNGLVRLDPRGGTIGLRWPDADRVVAGAGEVSAVHGGRAANLRWSGQAPDARELPPAVAQGPAVLWSEMRAPVSAGRAAVHAALHEGRVLAEVELLPTAEHPRSDVLAYEDVNVRVLPDGSQRVRLLIEGVASDARTVAVHVAPSVLSGELRVRHFDLDDVGVAHERGIDVVDGLDAVLRNPSERAASWTVTDEEGRHVLLSLPASRAHLVEIASVAHLPMPSVVAGGLAGAALVGVAVVALWRREPM